MAAGDPVSLSPPHLLQSARPTRIPRASDVSCGGSTPRTNVRIRFEMSLSVGMADCGEGRAGGEERRRDERRGRKGQLRRRG
eukprot:250089-Hanusia_phi.AAC.3